MHDQNTVLICWRVCSANLKVDMAIPGLQGRDVIVEKRPVKATMEKSKEQYAGPVTKC
jgi:hypothetical protein